MLSGDSRMTTVAALGAERRLLALAVGIAVSMLLGGCWLARLHEKPEWVNRSGAAITAAESLIAILESKRRSRLQRTLHVTNPSNPYIREEIEKAETHLLRVSIVLAVSGELIHGFGDLLFEAIFYH